MYLSTIRPKIHHRRSIWVASLLVILPRAIISLNYFRQFLIFAVLPIVFIAIARGWIKLTLKRAAKLFALGVCLVVVPSVLRGDFKSHSSSIEGENLRMYTGNSRMYVGSWLLSGSSLTIFEKFHTANISGGCSPLLVSLTEYIIPYRTLGWCTVPFAGTIRVADSNGLTTYMINGNGLSRGGTGATFILDLYWFGGILAVGIGSAVMGFTCRFFVESMGSRTIFNGIWAECLMRSLMAIRGTYGFVYERIPALVLTAIFCALIIRAALRGRSGPNRIFLGDKHE